VSAASFDDTLIIEPSGARSAASGGRLPILRR
jgi:hypothetical protein